MGAHDPAIEIVDRVFVDCAAEIRLFYHLAPLNEPVIRSEFLSSGCENVPTMFEYRPLEFSPAAHRKRLHEAPVDEIVDDVLRTLYSEKRWELDTLISLLEARGSAAFRELSLELFGRPPAALILEAKDLLATHFWADDESLEAEAVAGLLNAHLESYRCRYQDFDCEVVLEDAMSARMYVHENRVLVKRGARFSLAAARCDVVHEIDAHVLTWLNGRAQPLRLLEIGPRGTMAFQESLGVFVELAHGVMFPGRAIMLAARVVAVAAMLAGAEFMEVYKKLTVEHGIENDQAFGICVRVFRGGGFSKDWVCLSQIGGIADYLVGGGSLKKLVLGKITLDVLEDVDQLLEKGVVLPPRFLPSWAGKFESLSSDPGTQWLRGGESANLKLMLSEGWL